MCEYTTLTSYKEALVAAREALDNIDVDALVENRLAEMKANIKAEIVSDIDKDKLVADVKISAIEDAIAIVERNLALEAEAEQEEVTDEVPTEAISDETY